jgi:hypothetical protein
MSLRNPWFPISETNGSDEPIAVRGLGTERAGGLQYLQVSDVTVPAANVFVLDAPPGATVEHAGAGGEPNLSDAFFGHRTPCRRADTVGIAR